MRFLILLLVSLKIYAADNTIYIDQVGNNNQITIAQTFDTNSIGGISQSSAKIDGNSNSMNITQYSSNSFKIELNGDFNNISSNQHTGQQATLSMTGNNNLIIFDQLNNNKVINATVNGNNNLVDVEQKGTGNHQASMSLTGDGHSVTLRQRNTGNHSAQINLTNSGGPSILNVTQDSALNQTYSLTQNCSMLGGCITSITQQ